MKVPFTSSLGFKTGLTIVVVEALALTLLGTFYMRRFSAEVDRALRETLEKPGDLMSRGIINLNTVSQREVFARLVGPDLEEAMIVGANGNVFHATRPELIGVAATNDPAWNPAWLVRARRGAVVEELHAGRDAFLLRIAPIGHEAGRTPFLFSYVKIRTTAAERAKDDLRRYFCAGSVATVIVTTIALMLCFRFLVTTRLASVGRTIRRVAEGDLAARVQGRPGRDELGVMCEGVNKMAERLQHTIQSLEKTVGELNAAIAARKDAEEERLRLERQVLHAQKLESLGVLAGGIAHDFNNILTGILGYADLALLDLPEDIPCRDSLREIEKAARRAAGLAQQMLAYSGRGRFVITDFDLNEVVTEMGGLLSASVSKKARIGYALADELPPLRGDATQLRQVVMNLITNAAEAVEANGGSVTVRTGVTVCEAAFLTTDNPAFHARTDKPPVPGPYLFIEVQDTGPGMDAATLERIYDPFFTTKFTGRGLGLAVVLGIVRGHHGALKVRSRPGAGTTFTALFPLQPATHSLASLLSRDPDLLAWHAEGLVLLVDDEQHVVSLVRAMLQQMGLRVLAAADGREAVELFRDRAGEIRCVLLDLTMPRLDGVSAFREMRRIRADVPVILISGFSEQDATSRFEKGESVDFLAKPFTYIQLAARLKAALDGRSAPAPPPP